MDTNQYGKIEWNGKTLTLTQDPYPDTVSIRGEFEDFYVAHALDSEENDYEIYWFVTNAECEDASEACDWDDFIVRAL